MITLSQNRERNKQFFLFLFVGCINTLVGLSTIYLLKFVFHMSDMPANACGYAVGITVSFLLNRNITFRHRGPVLESFLRFFFVVALAYVVNLGVVEFAIRGLEVNSYLSQALGVPPYTLVGFIGSRLFAFPKTNEKCIT